MFTESTSKDSVRQDSSMKLAGRPNLASASAQKGAERRGLNGNVIESRLGDPLPIRGAENFRKEASARIGKERLPSAGIGLLVFLAFAVPFGLLLYGARSSPQWMDIYRQARWAGVGAPYLIVVIEGFRESSLRGLFCLIFPPYLLWHALTRMESYWRQSLVLGALALLAAEYVWFRDISLVEGAGVAVSRGIESVSGLIRRAGEAGDLK